MTSILDCEDLMYKIITDLVVKDDVSTRQAAAYGIGNFAKFTTKNFDKIIVIEVGAMFVGKIVNNPATEFTKGQEKGWFEPGGSTIVILTGKNVVIDDEIIENSLKGIETKLYCGEGIGSAI